MMQWDAKAEAFRQMYFASVNEAWRNLPEIYDGRFGSAAHLRKWALVKLHYANEQTIVLDSVADALRYVAYISRREPLSVVNCKANVVTVWTAKSQAKLKMNEAEFRESATMVLELLSDMLGTKVSELRKNAGRAA